MRSSDPLFTLDWFVVSLRWLVLTGAVLSITHWDSLYQLYNIPLLVILIWNIAVAMLTGLDLRIRYHREVNLAMDLLVAMVFFVLSGGFSHPAWWLGVMPVFTSVLYFEWRGIFITVPLIILTQIVFMAIHSPTSSGLLLEAGSAGLFLLFGVIFGFIGTRLVRIIRHHHEVELGKLMEKEELENERMRAVYGLTSTLTGTLNYQRVLESVLDLSLSAVNTDLETLADDRLVSVVMLFAKDSILEVASSRGLIQADKRVTMRGKSGAVARAIESDKPVLLRNIKSDPELNCFATFLSCREVYCFPLRSGFNAYGILLFGHPQQGFFSHEQRETLEILGRQAVIAIRNSRLYQELVEERDRMVEVQEEIRRKLARDLHDGPTQSVSAIAMRLDLVQQLLVKDPQAAASELNNIEELAKRTTREIRHMLFTLRPLILESQGLVAALKSMAEKVKEAYALSIEIQVHESILQQIELGNQSVIFYIVEEAIANVRKHAKASTVLVRLSPLEKDIALLEIQDNGIGFDVAAVTRSYSRQGSLGMVILQERTELINGVLNVQSSPGGGTCVQVYIPLSEEAADRLHRRSQN